MSSGYGSLIGGCVALGVRSGWELRIELWFVVWGVVVLSVGIGFEVGG